MNCDRYREAASARLDGEPLGLPATALDGHLASCTDCAAWFDAAARVTRMARLDVRPVPDLSDQIATEIALPARRVARRRRWLRVALLLAGIAQLLIGLPALTGDSIGMSMATHATHEAAAWNLAIGAAFAAAALVPRRAAGLIPLLGTFIVVLAGLSVHDVATGAVTIGRLVTHAAALIGLLVLVLLDRAERALPPSGWARDYGSHSGEQGDDKLRTVA